MTHPSLYDQIFMAQNWSYWWKINIWQRSVLENFRFDRLMINVPFYLGCQQSAEILHQISQIWIACSGTNAQPSTAWN